MNFLRRWHDGTDRSEKDAARTRLSRRLSIRAAAPAAGAFAAVVLCAGLAYASGGEGGHEGASASDWMWRVVNFSLVAGLLLFVFFKYVRGALKSRIEGIEASLAEAKAAREEAQRRLADVEARLKDKDAELKLLIDVAEENGRKEKEELIKESERMAEDLVASAKDNIDAELRKARENLRKEAALLAIELAEKMVRENIGKEDQARIIEEYITKVGAEK